MLKPLFVAAGQDGLRLVSEDGVKWTNKQVGRDGEFYRFSACGNGFCVVIGSYGGNSILASTADGIAWKTTKREAKYVSYIKGVLFANGKFVALGGEPGSEGDAAPFVIFSKDGVVWDGPAKTSVKFALRRTAWGDGRFVTVGDYGRRSTALDGKTWENAPKPKPIDTLVDVAVGKGVFVGVGLHGLRSTTKDGLKWSDPVRGEEGEHLNSVVYAKDRFVAVGAGATYTSPDGTEWQRHPNENAPQFVTYGNGIFVGAAWKGRLLVSTDGIKWRETFKCDKHVQTVAWGEVGS